MKILSSLLESEKDLESFVLNIPDKSMLKIAMAYGFLDDTVKRFLSHLENKKVNLFFYGRVDETEAIGYDLFKNILNYPYLKECKAFYSADDSKINLHAKVLFIESYGAYIGSANLTKRGWQQNVECGVWLQKKDLFKHQKNLNIFFNELKNHPHCKTLNKERLEEIKKLQENKPPINITEERKIYNKDIKDGIKSILQIDSLNKKLTIKQKYNKSGYEFKKEVKNNEDINAIRKESRKLFYAELAKRLKDKYPDINPSKPYHYLRVSFSPNHQSIVLGQERTSSRIVVYWARGNTKKTKENDIKLFQILKNKKEQINSLSSFEMGDDGLFANKYLDTFNILYDPSSHDMQMDFYIKQFSALYECMLDFIQQKAA